ncbi:hypothetical protein OIU79_028415 [Salix purpurea]|uniref:Uncharacterized protein n=1 Tax=Salix purpurea TaxID=77065 RepID=A0A9Q0VYV2_SALPP|nr:hypothetical protein OIU79_028415 [Salix purpurea]
MGSWLLLLFPLLLFFHAASAQPGTSLPPSLSVFFLCAKPSIHVFSIIITILAVQYLRT